MRSKRIHESGSIVVSILVVMMFLTVIIYSLIELANVNLSRARGRVLLLQAQYAAESGADAAIATLNNTNDSYTGTTTDVQVVSTTQYKAYYSVSVAAGSNSKEKVITATGKVYAPKTEATPRYTRKIESVTQKSGTTFATGLMARNIIYIDSGVKNVTARDVFANGFIQMNKNTTNLIADNISVIGKNTGASNCSIGGTGNLVKPTTFTDPAQTKTNITMGYNNCITPPGNTSNSSFNVLANQTNLSTVATTYIPWSSYMDSSYQDAGSCNDLTNGSFPRNLPSTNGSKKTHYPDDGNGVSLFCGLLGDTGDLTLGSGQYNINDNIHIRTSLCVLIACDVVFNNPSTTLRWIFVEGSVNFSSVQTAAGSGPIVMVVYGSDPLTKILNCPYGGATYVGQFGSTQTKAPALYLLSMNGICIDKTKFGASPALGGLSGKNIYIASNSGTPFDLKLDPLFPVEQIQTDVAWKAVRYRRL